MRLSGNTSRYYIVDANAILRLLLGDIEEQKNYIKEFVNSYECMLTLEVLSEVVYVLEGVYQVPREAIAESIKKLLFYVEIEKEDVCLKALGQYISTPKLDFVDCLLFGYKTARNYPVVTFDKKLEKLLK